MKTFERVCIQDYKLEAENGDCLILNRGNLYITSEEDGKGTVVVFSSFWCRVPASLFAGPKQLT
jgi:hypothetical protein